MIKVYRSSTDPTEHKKTAHYQTWRDAVAEMMAEPRSSIKYDNIFPDDEGWEQSTGISNRKSELEFDVI